MSTAAPPIPAEAAPAPLEPSLKRKAVRGTIWTAIGFGAAQAIRFGSNIILTRLLDQYAFGLMQIVNAFMQGLQMFSDIGLGPNIIQSTRGDDRKFLNTAWTIQVIRGAIVCLIASAIAYPAQMFYEAKQEPGHRMLLWILPVAGFSALLGGFNSTVLYTLNKRLSLGKLTIWNLGCQFVGVGTMVVWAYLHHSVWALVGGGVAAAIAKLVSSHSMAGADRDRFGWDRSAAWELLTFGGWIFVSTALTFLALQGDKLILGRLTELGVVGVYGLAFMLSRLPVEVVLNLGGAVVFPAYSHAKNTGADFGAVFRKIRFPVCAMGVMLATGVGVCGPDVIRLIWTPKWWDAAGYLALLSLSGLFQILECTSGSALLALGKAKFIALGSGVKVAGLFALIPLGYTLGEANGLGGINGALYGLAAAEAARYLTSATCIRLAGLPVFLHDVGLIALSVGTYFLARTLSAMSTPTAADQPSFVRLLVGGVIVLAAFAIPLAKTARNLRRGG